MTAIFWCTAHVSNFSSVKGIVTNMLLLVVLILIHPSWWPHEPSKIIIYIIKIVRIPSQSYSLWISFLQTQSNTDMKLTKVTFCILERPLTRISGTRSTGYLENPVDRYTWHQKYLVTWVFCWQVYLVPEVLGPWSILLTGIPGTRSTW